MHLCQSSLSIIFFPFYMFHFYYNSRWLHFWLEALILSFKSHFGIRFILSTLESTVAERPHAKSKMIITLIYNLQRIVPNWKPKVLWFTVTRTSSMAFRHGSPLMKLPSYPVYLNKKQRSTSSNPKWMSQNTFHTSRKTIYIF